MTGIFKEVKLQVHSSGLLIHEHSEPCNSHVEQYIDHLLVALSGRDTHTSTDTGGTTTRVLERPIDSSANWMFMSESVDTDDFGIWIGTGTTAVALTDYTLATKIAHGTGATQMTYQATTTGTITSNRQYTVSRAFGNTAAGGDIIVAEIGIVVSTQYETTTEGFFLIERTVLGSTVTVSDGQTLTVEYTIDIPAIV